MLAFLFASEKSLQRQAAKYCLQLSCRPMQQGPKLLRREVLQLLAEGKAMKQAAGILAVTPRTIGFHKYRMMEKLQIKKTAR